MNLLKDNPHKSDDLFFFYSQKMPDSPCDKKLLLKGFKSAMDSVNEKFKEAADQAKLERPEMVIDYKARNICFHSWRHYWVTCGAKKAEDKKVMEASGHLTKNVFRTYAEHYNDNDIREVGKAMHSALQQLLPENILQFKKGA
jgi:integrase